MSPFEPLLQSTHFGVEMYSSRPYLDLLPPIAAVETQLEVYEKKNQYVRAQSKAIQTRNQTWHTLFVKLQSLRTNSTCCTFCTTGWNPPYIYVPLFFLIMLFHRCLIYHHLRFSSSLCHPKDGYS